VFLLEVKIFRIRANFDFKKKILIFENKKQMATKSKLSKLKKGDFFRFEGKRKVYLFDGGGKVRGFRYYADDDISSDYTTKTDRKVETGFTY
jgi:hypothetical protein